MKSISRAHRHVIEALERRNMKSATSIAAETNITDLSSTAYTAELSWGDNGANLGSDGAQVGTSDTPDNSMQVQWDSDLSDGVDSGWVAFNLTLDLSGTGTSSFTVGSQSFSFSPSTSGSISNVYLQTAVQDADLASSLQSVQIAFYSGGTQVDSATVAAQSANLIDSSDSSEESLTQVSTSASNVDKIVVTGSVRFQAGDDTPPLTTDIFSKICVA